jgi:hypothetical protein
MVRHHFGSRVAAGLMVGAALLAASGCASGASKSSAASPGQAGQPSASATTPVNSGSPTPTTSASVDQDSAQAKSAIATYRALWADVVKVEATMNDQDPTLADHLTGGALSFFQQAIHVNKLDGYVAKGEPKLLHPTAKQIIGSGDAAKVLVEDCVDDSGFNLYTTDGTFVHNGHPGGRRLTQALVEQSGGVLKASAFAFSAPGTC